LFAVLALLVAATAPDGGEPSYEDRLVSWALEQHPGRVVEPKPEGLKVEEVLVAAEDVFSASDPWPNLLNIFHVRTKEGVIRREVLVEVGDRWDATRVEETERILRRLFIFAVAKIIPLKGSDGGVALLVVTKDRWSLRLNSDFSLVGNLLQLLRLRPTEQNFLGRNQQVLIDFLLKLDTLAISQQFEERRLFGSNLSLGETAGLIFNRQTGAVEGTSGLLFFGKSLLSLQQKWAYQADGYWNVRTRRTFCGARVCLVTSPDQSVKVPRVYDVRNFGANLSLTRSFGSDWKTDVTAALGGYSVKYGAPNGSALNPDQLALLESEVLPRSEDATFVLVRARFFKADFRVLRNIDTFQLAEDYQVGPLVQAGVRYAIPTFTRTHFVEAGAAIRYRWLSSNENVLTATVAGAARFVVGGPIVDRHIAAELVNASPPFEGGRLVTRLVYDLKKDDLDNRVVLLGGGNGLRGAPAELLSGKNLFLANVEYRTRSFELSTIFVGFVLFYDAGSAFDARVEITHTVGIGLRILLPQFNQETIRIDLGFVLGGPNIAGADRFSATFGQVTDLRPAFLDDPI
jgi:hypothetical protein